MTINEKLLPNLDNYEYYNDCPHELIKNFLMKVKERDFLKRQELAVTAIDKIMQAHNKQELLHHVSELARIEHGIREIEPQARDHVVHALLSYLLGIYINEKFIYNIIGKKVDPFQWKLAGLFHDIGYPAQIAKDILSSYTDKINKIRKDIGVESQEIYFRLTPIGLEKLQNNVNSFDLFQKNIDEWDLKINASNIYKYYIKNGKICHGMISALCVIYIVDLLYQKNNPNRKLIGHSGWSQEYFDNDVVPACTAIFIHNLPSQYFKDSKIFLEKSPIAYLLKLSDSLQDWERPSHKNTQGFSANAYDIEVKNEELFFYTPAERKEKIKKEVIGSISANHIKILNKTC